MSIISFPSISLSSSRFELLSDSTGFSLRIGSVSLFVCRDYVSRKRIPAWFEQHGEKGGGARDYLILRRWLVSLSKASAVSF